MCLGILFKLDPAALPWVYLLVITLPCTDFSTTGKQLGERGTTGWMFVAAVRLLLQMPVLPRKVEIETADGITATNGGKELREAKLLLARHYKLCQGEEDRSLGAGAVPPGTYCQAPQCHLVKRPRGLPV